MSRVKLELCEQTLKECYGDIVATIGMYLLQNKTTPLNMIVQRTKMDPKQVRQALCSLIQQNIVSFYRSTSGFVEYTALPDAVLWRLRYPKYIHCAKTLFGDAAELLVEELLLQGRCTLGEAVTKTVKKLNESLAASGSSVPEISHSLIRDKASNLVRARLLRRCEDVIKDKDGKVVSMTEIVHPELLFDPPRGHDFAETVSGSKRSAAQNSEIPLKRIKLETGDAASTMESEAERGPSYWCVNVHQFHHHFRDQAIIAAVARIIDQKASEVMRTMLRLSETKTIPTDPSSADLSFTEIYNAIPKDKIMTRNVVDQYLKCLSQNCCDFVTKAVEALSISEIETVVLERFGSKALRMYRVLLAEKQVEQKQVEEKAMLPPKEAKELLYKMFAENFVTLTELSKAPDHAPARTFYFFNVNLLQVSRMILEKCYKAAANVMIRRQKCILENKRLLDKQERVEAIISSLDAESAAAQKEEIEQMVTPSERKQLKKVEDASKMLETSELLLDHTIFILETYISYTLKPLPLSKK
ncbi:DNA-directed RNA polymerase iii subunit rpc3-like [Plakobranchus ocellatus]|uniref:DNA-directed RNA polymerase III subunit RPC3 n=1 Tax=Plakobranchus ocellatus TaxID=259542 RepID=A0AAV4B2W6_9GAST|nr:DNA-directed RNA polymerase iii subunit rpc3-like [Plakobranchus ocellatus]